jgi:hypothetical protein
MIYILDEMEQNGARFPHACQNDAQFKSYELITSVILHAIYTDLSLSVKTETAGN